MKNADSEDKSKIIEATEEITNIENIDKIHQALALMASNELNPEISDLFLEICTDLTEPEEYGLCIYLFNLYKFTKDPKIFQNLFKISLTPAFPVDNFVDINIMQDLITIGVDIGSDLCFYAISIIDIILSKTEPRKYLEETDFYKSLLIFSLNFELSGLLVNLLKSEDEISNEIANISASVLEFIRSTDAKQQINGLIALAFLYKHNIKLDSKYIYKCLERFGRDATVELSYWLIFLLAHLDEFPREYLPALIQLLEHKELQDSILTVLTRFREQFSQEEINFVIENILESIDNFAFKVKHKAFLLLLDIIDFQTFFSATLFSNLVSALQENVMPSSYLSSIMKILASPAATPQQQLQMYEIIRDNISTFQDLAENSDEMVSQFATVIIQNICPDM